MQDNTIDLMGSKAAIAVIESITELAIRFTNNQPDYTALEAAAPLLLAPFPPTDISFKVGATTKTKEKCKPLAYADLRAYMNALDRACGGNWSVNYVPWNDKLICNLTLFGITRSSTGEHDTTGQGKADGPEGTSVEAQAFKRACAMFGLGRYLYGGIPNLPYWVEYDEAKRSIAPDALKQLEQAVVNHYRSATGDNGHGTRNNNGKSSTSTEKPPQKPPATTPQKPPQTDADPQRRTPPPHTSHLPEESFDKHLTNASRDDIMSLENMGKAFWGEDWIASRKGCFAEIGVGAYGEMTQEQWESFYIETATSWSKLVGEKIYGDQWIAEKKNWAGQNGVKVAADMTYEKWKSLTDTLKGIYEEEANSELAKARAEAQERQENGTVF